MPEPVRYRVVLTEPQSHRLTVEATFPARPGGRHDLLLPVWTPGSYLVRDYARHLGQVTARDAGGRALAAVKTGGSAWRVEGARGRLRVRYEVYAFERSVRTSHVDHAHAFLSPAGLFLYEEALRGRPCRVAVKAPRGWKTACALPLKRGQLEARDYDHLVDSPIECGRLREIRYRVEGTPFRLVVCGEGPFPVDAQALKRDLARVSDTQRRIYGGFPFSSYLTILNLTSSTKGGLEHRDSTALEWPRDRMTGQGYTDFLSLYAHELFHAWNVKDARPKAFTPYGYGRPNHTRLLWWFEGVTDYYGVLSVRRAGLLSARAYLDKLMERWEKLLETPGRRAMSAAGASFDAWIKLYRPDENSVNSAVSYYEKGHLLGALLDLEVLRRTGGKKSLDQVAREVHRRGKKGLAEGGMAAALRAATGLDFAPWITRHVDGTAELPFARALRTVGLVLRAKESDGKPGKPEKAHAGAAAATTSGEPPAAGWLGVVLRANGGRLSVASVLRGGAGDRAGLSAGDELLALDGARVDEASLKDRVAVRKPGERVRLTLFRDELLREVEVELATAPRKLRAVPAAPMAPEARKLLEAWLGADALEELERGRAPSGRS